MTEELGEGCASLYRSSFDITRYHRPGSGACTVFEKEFGTA